MTTLLEQRYRTVLRLLPPSYRAGREDEMVETYLLGVAEEDQELMRPALGEVASVAALAVRVRLGAAGASPGQARLGAAVRLYALLAVLLLAASALTDRAIDLAWAHSSPRYGAMFTGEFTGHGLGGDLRQGADWGLPLLWTAAFAALLGGRRRTARICAVLAAVPTATALADAVTQRGSTELPAAAAAFAWLTVAAVVCGHHSDAPPARLPLLPPGQALLGACVLMGGSIAASPVAVDSEWSLGTAYLVAAAGWALVRLAARARPPARPTARPTAGPGGADGVRGGAFAAARGGAPEGAGGDTAVAVTLALAALGLPVLALRLAMLSLLLRTHLTGAVVTCAAVQAAAIGLAVVALAAAGTRSLAPIGRRARTDS